MSSSDTLNPPFVASQLPQSDQQRLAQALVETTRLINQSLNLGEVLQLILETIGNVVPHDAANVMLLEDGIAWIAAICGYEKIGANPKNILKQRRDIATVPNLRRMAETGASIVIPDTASSPEWVSFATSDWIHSYLSTPIRHNGITIGFINLNSSTRGLYNKRHAENLRSFADGAAIAIQNARLYEKAKDELAFREKVELQLQKAMGELEQRVEQRTAELRHTNQQLQLELQRRQTAERALELEHALLAKRVEERTAELSAANAELAKAARMKDAFLANMSHELRTPLNAILNIAETLEEQIYGLLNERQDRAIHTLSQSASHLLSLINDILDLSKIGAGKFELMMDVVPVAALCSSSLKLVENAAQKMNIQLSLVIDPAVKIVWGDLRRLKQVLVNLLSNAIKFTPAGGCVGLLVESDPSNRSARFTVWDTGIGIADEGIQRLFKPFVQLDNSLARKYEGSGLGLALSYRIVELHGGGLSVSSEEGKGSQFSVTLRWDEHFEQPVEDAPSRAALPTAETFGSVRQNIERLFLEFGIEHSVVPVDSDVLGRVVESSSNIIVINVPIDSACRSVIQALRADSRTRSIPILVSTQGTGPLDAAGLPEGVVPFNLASSRQEFRRVLRNVSSQGTASLIRRAALINAGTGAGRAAETRILIVDDNEVTVRPLYDYLTYRKFQVQLAYNGAEAIEKARGWGPHLILMDIQMPGMDGVETIRRIRRDMRIQNIPVVALTALAMQGDRRRCMEAGANGYFSKPISISRLIEVIESHAAAPDIRAAGPFTP